MAANAQRAAMSLQQQLDADIAAIENYNKGVRTVNDRIGDILHEVSGQPATSTRTAWYQWWIDLLGYTKVPDPKVPRTFIQNIGPFEGNVPLPPPEVDAAPPPAPAMRSNGCFAPGTAVWTHEGMLTIESVRPGDLVLTQDAFTGKLSYEPVLFAQRGTSFADVGDLARQPRDRQRLAFRTVLEARQGLGDGKGLETRRRAPGEGRSCDGQGNRPSPTQARFNVDVAKHASIFVGKMGALAHDNTPAAPIAAVYDAAVEPGPAKPAPAVKNEDVHNKIDK